jgi:hypothetical protein
MNLSSRGTHMSEHNQTLSSWSLHSGQKRHSVNHFYSKLEGEESEEGEKAHREPVTLA